MANSHSQSVQGEDGESSLSLISLIPGNALPMEVNPIPCSIQPRSEISNPWVGRIAPGISGTLFPDNTGIPLNIAGAGVLSGNDNPGQVITRGFHGEENESRCLAVIQ